MPSYLTGVSAPSSDFAPDFPEHPDQQRAFVDALASVGTSHVYLSYRPCEPRDADAAKAVKTLGCGYHTVNVARERLRAWIKRGAQEQQSVILRPCADVLRIESTLENGKRSQKAIKMPFGDRRGVIFIQLDDIGDRDQDGNKIPHSDDRTKAIIERLKSVTLFTIRTSPKSIQVWIAIRKAEFASDADRTAFRARLVAGCNADIPASCATRVAGSINFKERYAEDGGDDYGVNYPVVSLGFVSHETIASRSVLESLGILAPVQESVAQVRTTNRREGGTYVPSPLQGDKPSGAFPRYEQYDVQAEDMHRIDARIAWLAIHRWNRNPQDVFQYIYFQSPRASDVCARRGEAVWRREVERTVNYAATGRHGG